MSNDKINVYEQIDSKRRLLDVVTPVTTTRNTETSKTYINGYDDRGMVMPKGNYPNCRIGIYQQPESYNYDTSKKKLLKAIYIKADTLPDSLTFIGLDLYGQLYFRIGREEIEKCYTNNINLLEYWGFSQSIPIFNYYSYLVFDYDGNADKNTLFNFNFIEDDFNIYKKIISNKYIDIPFFDKRIQGYNYLRCGGGYGIAYCL